jgi:hypothetical protein
MNPPENESGTHRSPKVEDVSFDILPPEKKPGNPREPQADPPKPKITTSSFASTLGLVIAVAADAIEIAVPASWLLVDAVTVAAFILIWGFRWEILVALLPEAIPGIDFFPTWTLLAVHLSRESKS